MPDQSGEFGKYEWEVHGWAPTGGSRFEWQDGPVPEDELEGAGWFDVDLLRIQVTDPDDPDRHWYVTVGGPIPPEDMDDYLSDYLDSHFDTSEYREAV